MSQEGGGSWGDLTATARQKAKDIADDPRTQKAMARAASGAEKATKHLDATRRKVTQEEAWAEATVTIEELVEVVVVQQELLGDLLARVAELESKATANPK